MSFPYQAYHVIGGPALDVLKRWHDAYKKASRKCLKLRKKYGADQVLLSYSSFSAGGWSVVALQFASSNPKKPPEGWVLFDRNKHPGYYRPRAVPKRKKAENYNEAEQRMAAAWADFRECRFEAGGFQKELGYDGPIWCSNYMLNLRYSMTSETYFLHVPVFSAADRKNNKNEKMDFTLLGDLKPLTEVEYQTLFDDLSAKMKARKKRKRKAAAKKAAETRRRKKEAVKA